MRELPGGQVGTLLTIPEAKETDNFAGASFGSRNGTRGNLSCPQRSLGFISQQGGASGLCLVRYVELFNVATGWRTLQGFDSAEEISVVFKWIPLIFKSIKFETNGLTCDFMACDGSGDSMAHPCLECYCPVFTTFILCLCAN